MSKINISNLKLVNPKFTEQLKINTELIKKSIKDNTYEKYGSIDESTSESFDFISFLCDSLETCNIKQSSNPVYRIDKKKIIIQILVEMFPNKNIPQYLNMVDNFIEHSHIKGYIKALPITKKIKKSIKNYLIKKFC